MISAREPKGSRDDIWTRADKGYDMKKWRVMICLSYTSTREIADLYQNALSFLARIKYMVIEQLIDCFNMQLQ
jgi:hypothetical protein